MDIDKNERVYKINSNYILRKIADSYMIVPIGDQIAQFGGLINATASVAAIWDLLKVGATKKQLEVAMIDKYEVDKEQVAEDVEQFLNSLERHKMLVND